ncbi:hypothetical protein SETIT_9G580100v2 [Setaria italica]|uniref:Uncharacterized protein n=1 Tax=Setaria italica TaxID=4555 RepID=A0A368SXA2_SETIT|nr:hypothetical protein SETIT_9G580100v2 [Setaria italica]
MAMADILSDFGARDPFPEEIELALGEKVLGNVDTLHQILIPTLSALSLARLLLQPGAEPLSLDDVRRFLLKVIDWRLLLSDEQDDQRQPVRLQCVWKVRDEPCSQELLANINAALDGAGHAPDSAAPRGPHDQPAAGGEGRALHALRRRRQPHHQRLHPHRHDRQSQDPRSYPQEESLGMNLDEFYY